MEEVVYLIQYYQSVTNREEFLKFATGTHWLEAVYRMFRDVLAKLQEHVLQVIWSLLQVPRRIGQTSGACSTGHLELTPSSTTYCQTSGACSTGYLELAASDLQNTTLKFGQYVAEHTVYAFFAFGSNKVHMVTEIDSFFPYITCHNHISDIEEI
jgi:hypothetical protein